jgi:3-hydroxymyristoyl/3-hydroxydecanoyl-(acyl carrier protein) dehydratase
LSDLIFSIAKDHPCLAGHFPHQPIVPGVVILTEVCALLKQYEPSAVIEGVRKVKFLQKLLPEQECLVVFSRGLKQQWRFEVLLQHVHQPASLLAEGSF